ncbi:MAG: hypothetical protein GX195_05635 [Firmicutes bacterium]|nr:hypothetical protein [Bacillota bacterium]
MIPRLAPMLASAKPLDREEGFVHEIKWDGYRVLAYIEEGQVDLVSRNGRSLAARFPELVPLLSSLPSQPLALDGEVLVLGEHGLPVFAALQGSGRGRTLAYAVFDVLYFSGENICPLPWLERRTKLTSLLSAAGPVFVSPTFPGSAAGLLATAKRLGLEGIVSKQIDAPYLPGMRSDAWRKTRVVLRDDFVVGGLRVYNNAIRSMLVGQYSPQSGALLYCGSVGSGLSQTDLRFLLFASGKLAAVGPPFVDAPRDRDVAWLKPQIVVEIEFLQFTPERRLRHPVFIRFRWDKKPGECLFTGGRSCDADGGN